MATKKKKPEIVIDDTVRALVNSRVDVAMKEAAKKEKQEDGSSTSYFDALGGPLDKGEVDMIKQLVAERLTDALVNTVDSAIDLVLDTALAFSPDDDDDDDDDADSDEGSAEGDAQPTRRRFSR